MDGLRRRTYNSGGMRRILVKSAIALTCLIALLIAWVAGARPLSLLLDRLHNVQIDSQPIAQLGIGDASGGMLRINDFPMSTAMPNYSPYPMTMKVDPAREFVVQSGDHAIVLGRVDDSLGEGRGTAIKPEPGDKARFRIERGLLSWPTPLDFNFMSGHSPSWKRHLYYRLIWEKPDGGRLEMVWRYEQYYYDGWASGFMTRQGTTGLIRVDIRP
jgi:hypothetical protein